ALDPLHHAPDPPLRGTIVHRILERFISEGPVTDLDDGIARLSRIADSVLLAEAAWPAARRIWKIRLMRVAEWFVTTEIERQETHTPLLLEHKGRLLLPDLDVTLYGKPDRIDARDDGHLVVYDYKTGAPPSKPQQTHFDKQLMLAALIAEQGGLEGMDARTVAQIAYIGLGASPKFEPVTLEPGDVAQVSADLHKLLAAYQARSRGYTSRRAVDLRGYGGDYDHLARFGEWDQSHDPDVQEVG
ncbi:MAG: PD-(D/E)XK nuclease family protein, partial [Rhodobacter sp.]|nr:PD-(D/E)XK nuclease family protein [Rhodobacter sp.]